MDLRAIAVVVLVSFSGVLAACSDDEGTTADGSVVADAARGDAQARSDAAAADAASPLDAGVMDAAGADAVARVLVPLMQPRAGVERVADGWWAVPRAPVQSGCTHMEGKRVKSPPSRAVSSP